MRILWVVPRFGPTVVGGAETLVRALALRAMPPDWGCEVATTCATDHATWRNALPAGKSRDGDVLVRRFAVDPRDERRHAEAHRVVAEGRAGYVDELEWLASGVWSADLGRFLEGADHDLVVLCPYLFGTTLWGAQAAPERAAVLPCLHDEAYARLRTVERVMAAVRGCIFNAPAEERLARRLFAVRDGGVAGMGFDPPAAPAPAGFAERHGLGRYVIYAGRLEEGKRVDVAVEHAVRYARERPGAPTLVLIGSGGYAPPPAARHAVRLLGYLDEAEKRSALAGAAALVNPSHMESLSIVLMEAWLEGTPALVATGSEVMRDHCEESGGGIAFGSYEEYRDALDGLLADPAAACAMGARGRDYVLDVYGWPAVSARFRDVAERLAA
jgi:glycosyltransferase involved in cell wall biosynthesis